MSSNTRTTVAVAAAAAAAAVGPSDTTTGTPSGTQSGTPSGTVLSNRISFELDPETRAAIDGYVLGLQQTLQVRLESLTAEQRRVLAKMGSRTVDFVRHACGHCHAFPQFRAGFQDVDEFQRDLDAIDTLTALRYPLARLLAMIDDSIMLAGSDAMQNALSFYDVLKTGARRGDPAAQAAAADLAQRLPKRRRSRAPVATPAPAPISTTMPAAADPVTPLRLTAS